MKKLAVQLPDTTFIKLSKKKREDGFGGKSWKEWFMHLTKNVSIVDRFDEAITKGTRTNLAPLWMENFVMNIPLIIPEDYPEDKDKYSIGQLPKHEGEPALIIAAGPSIHEKNHIQLLADKGFGGKIFACDRMLIPLLKAGVIPDYVACVDGNREKIVKWFDDPIVDKYAKKIKGLFTTTTAPNAAKRFKDAGGQLFWFHGMLDQFYNLDSVTSFMNYMTGSTAISCGGNVGGACWTLAYYLKCSKIILIGLDLGYTKDTPIEETAYYEQLSASGAPLEGIQPFYEEGINPDFSCQYYTDIVFKHYKEALLEMVAMADIETINATGGGSLFGPGIKGMKFEKVLEEYGGEK